MVKKAVSVFIRYFLVAAAMGVAPLSAGENGAVLVPAGNIEYGSGKGEFLKTVYVNGFLIDRFEVTNAKYSRFRPGHEFPVKKAAHPVANVSWYDAVEYCASVGKRLPTEVEWEKAARGSILFNYPWGDVFDADKCNSSEAEIGGTTIVGRYKKGKSVYGVFDMAGNVREWVDGWYGNKRVYRVLRGGSYMDNSESVRTYTRHKRRPEDKEDYIGFRCAETAVSENDILEFNDEHIIIQEK